MTAAGRARAIIEAVDLPDITVREYTDVMRDAVMVRVVQSFPSGRQYVAQSMLPRELLDEPAVADMVGQSAWAMFRPWLRPDDIGWPAFEPFPRATAAWERIRRVVRRGEGARGVTSGHPPRHHPPGGSSGSYRSSSSST